MLAVLTQEEITEEGEKNIKTYPTNRQLKVRGEGTNSIFNLWFTPLPILSSANQRFKTMTRWKLHSFVTSVLILLLFLKVVKCLQCQSCL